MRLAVPGRSDVAVSIRRADYWLDEVIMSAVRGQIVLEVSIRRADYWLVEAPPYRAVLKVCFGFNPPGGLLVG